MPKLPKPLPEPVDENLVLLDKYTKFLDALSRNKKYRELLYEFNKDESVKTYNKLALFLRKASKALDEISPLGGLLLSSFRGIPIYNSRILDNFNENLVGASSSNSFKNYQAGTIVYDNGSQTKSVTISQVSRKSTVLQSDPACRNKFSNAIYTSKTRRGSTLVVGQFSVNNDPFFHHV